MEIFERQLNSVDGAVGLVTEPGAINKYLSEIEERGNVHYLNSKQEIRDAADQARLDLVIVVGNNIESTKTLYANCMPIIAKGVPVVFGIQERSLFFSPPTWQSRHMAEVFYYTSSYIRGSGQTGSYLEFGVFDGRSFTLAYHALESVCDKFYAFDSYQGIVGTADGEESLYPEGSYCANIETFKHNANLAGLDASRVHPIKGAFQETLHNSPENYGIKSVSVCHIDSDIYEAAYLALNFIEPVLQNGALILFDEYNAFAADPKKGERRAVAQWLEENPSITMELYSNYTPVASAFIFRRSTT